MYYHLKQIIMLLKQLIDWNNIPNDPIFVLTFPQKGMLKPEHYEKNG